MLAGIASEARFNPASIHRYGENSFALLAARTLIDSWNARRTWPPMSCDGAARKACPFVEDRWTEISNVALALGDSLELDDFAVKTFASCCR